MIGAACRRLGVALVFAAGIGSILATSRIPGIYFIETSIRPAWRCPGADVAISWTLNEPAPISVSYPKGVVRLPAEAGRLIVPAAVFDLAPPITEMKLRIEAKNADFPDTYEITTLGGAQTVGEQAYLREDGQFVMNQGGVWDSRIHVTGFGIGQVDNLLCEGGIKQPPAWLILPPSGPPFTRRGADNSTDRIVPARPAGRKWRLRPYGAECKAAPTGLQPVVQIQLTVGCPSEPADS